MTASRKYDVYGLVRAGDNGTSRHKFVGSLGHTSEDETGLIYMRARWMDPSLGRFTSEDPARDGANWFEYCRGNPVNAVDPDGKRWLNVSAWFMGVAFASLAAAVAIGARYSYSSGSGFVKAMVLAQGLATIATACFAWGAFGSDHGSNPEIVAAIGIGVGLLQGVLTCMLAGVSEGSKSLAASAVVGSFVYGTAVLGYCVAADIAFEFGR